MMQSIYSHRIMNENKNYGFVKTKPIKPNTNPIFDLGAKALLIWAIYCIPH